jgi:HNH endonuclease
MSHQGPWTIYIPKKRQGEELDGLRKKRQRLADDEKRAKRLIKARGAFNEDFFSGASHIENITLERLRVASDMSFSQFEGDLAAWSNEQAARDLFCKLRAADDRAKRFQERSDALARDKKKPRGNLRAMFIKLFANARSGLDIKGIGEGPRDPGVQSTFRKQLFKDMNLIDERGYAWCPILHDWYEQEDMTASHIFSYKHGQEMMDEIFGKFRPSELFSSRNGIVVHKFIEKEFDKGVFVIVPDIPDRFSLETVKAWVTGDVREFKIRIINSLFHKLDRGVTGPKCDTWRNLDGRRLIFRSNNRPAARYLYFHYCLQILRRAWQTTPEEQKALALYEEFGQYVWATPGRYIGRKMLRALVDTLGHEYKDLLRGASMSQSDGNHLLDCLTQQISDTPNRGAGLEEDEGDEAESVDDNDVLLESDGME